MSDRGASRLKEMEQCRASFGGMAPRKLAILKDLETISLRRSREVFRLHEVLCFLRAYPDDASVLSQVERMIEGFDSRSDLRRHRDALADTGIAGTATHDRFFAPVALWVARRWPDRLTVDWKEIEDLRKLEPFLSLFALHAETPGLDEVPLSSREWLSRMKGPRETDAVFLLRRLAALPCDSFMRETIIDVLDISMVLSPGPGTPSRTRAVFRPERIHFQTRPLPHARPALLAEIARGPRSVRYATPRESGKLIELARGMMVTLHRDLDVFSYASEEDVRLADCGNSLVFAFIGFVPERRLMLETLYGYLLLKNGVPLGYGTVASLFGSSEIAYNVAETFRGGEAAFVFARLLACVKSFFGSDTFSLDRYQLGEGNDEALRSGAWWFYQKLGFRALDASVRRLMREERRRMKKDPRHRSSIATLKKLSAASVFFRLGRPRQDVLGALAPGNVGLRMIRYLAERFGSDRERAARVCSREAALLLGVRSLGSFSRGERLAWKRWSPLVVVLPRIERWSARDCRALVDVIRAKGGRRESEFLRRFDAHRRLRRALADVAAMG